MILMLKKKISLAVLVIIALIAVFGKNGLMEYLQVKKDLQGMRAQLGNLKIKNLDENADLYGLQTSNAFLEKKAREELKLSKPKETIYLFTNKD